MKKTVKKLVSVAIILSIFFSMFQVNASAASDNSFTITDVVSVVTDTFLTIFENIGDTSTPLIVKLREIFGYYNIRSVGQLKRAVKTDDKYNHYYELKKNLVIDEEILVTGDVFISSDDYFLSTTPDAKALFNIQKGANLKLSHIYFNTQCPIIINHGNFSAARCNLSPLSTDSTFYIGEENSEATFRDTNIDSKNAVDIILNGPNAKLSDLRGNVVGELEIKPDSNNKVILDGSQFKKIIPEMAVPEIDFSDFKSKLTLGEDYTIPEVFDTKGTTITAVASIASYQTYEILQTVTVEGSNSTALIKKINDALEFDKLPKEHYSLNISLDNGTFSLEKSAYFILSDFYINSPVTSYSTYYYYKNFAEFRVHFSTLILAAADGKIVEISHDETRGYFIKIEHRDNYTTFVYAPELETYVEVGDTVNQGDTIALFDINKLLMEYPRAIISFEIFHNGEPVKPFLHIV